MHGTNGRHDQTSLARHQRRWIERRRSGKQLPVPHRETRSCGGIISWQARRRGWAWRLHAGLSISATSATGEQRQAEQQPHRQRGRLGNSSSGRDTDRVHRESTGIVRVIDDDRNRSAFGDRDRIDCDEVVIEGALPIEVRGEAWSGIGSRLGRLIDKDLDTIDGMPNIACPIRFKGRHNVVLAGGKV